MNAQIKVLHSSVKLNLRVQNNGLCVRNLSPAKRIKLCVPTNKSVCEIFFPRGQAPIKPVLALKLCVLEPNEILDPELENQQISKF